MTTLRMTLLASLLVLFACGSVLAMTDPSHRDALTLQGVVEKMPAGLYGAWVIDGHRVLVTPQTRVDQDQVLATLGSRVEVYGFFRGETFRARVVRILPGGEAVALEAPGHRHETGNFHGIVRDLPRSGRGYWQIDEHRVLVDSLTRIEEALGKAVVGALVKVSGYYRNSTFYADRIGVK